MNKTCGSNGYFPSPGSSIGSNSIASMIKLNVTIYFTPELPFIPPALTRQPQKVLDIVKIMVVMAPYKSVAHLKQQISKTISIISKDERLSFNNLELYSIRNSQNFVAHNEMILGHVFHHDENIYAIVISQVGRLQQQYIASPQSDRNQSHQHYQHGNDKIHDSKSLFHHGKYSSHPLVDRNERSRQVQSRDNITTSEDSGSESDGSYESSFVEKEDREGFLDLEAEETDGSESSDNSPSKFKDPVSSNRKVSLTELKKRRKSLIKVSESEEDEYPEQFKSHSHYVTNLVEDKIKLKSEENGNGLENQDDKEVDTEVVVKEMDMDQENVSEQAKNNTTESSSESSEEEEPDQANISKGNEIVRDSGNDSETTSEAGSDSSEETTIEENEDSNFHDKPVESTSQPKSNLETEKDSVDSKIEKQDSNSKESTPSKPSKSSKKSSVKRKYSSLSEIASNASNHSSSSKAEKRKNQSRFSSSSSDSDSSESQNSNGKKVKRSSLKSLSKDGMNIFKLIFSFQ